MACILVVDDESAVRSIIGQFLEIKHHTVLEAGDGAEALRVCAGQHVDLVVSDIDMPGTDGFELLATLKRQAPDLPVLIVTGKPSVQAAVTCFKTGAVDFLTKPLDFARLLEIVGKTLNLAHEGTLSRQPPAAAKVRQLAGYQIERSLGSGTFGVVFLAYRETAGQREYCALKVLRSGQAGEHPSPEVTARFLREAEAAARVEHPNVVKIHNYGWAEEEGIPYIAMEFIAGRSLKEHIEQHTQWDLPQRVELVRQLAGALGAIHDAKLCHRDIKSQNVLVTEQLQAKLTDFGVVKLPESQLTMSGRLIGTPSYMAPEAFLSPNVDARADLYSLGVVAYELLLGRLPYVGDTAAQLAVMVRQRRPPEPRQLAPDFPKSLQYILARLLKKAPEERYRSAAELLADLDAHCAGTSLPGMGLFSIFRTEVLTRDWA